jgi:hypothetical protein
MTSDRILPDFVYGIPRFRDYYNMNSNSSRADYRGRAMGETCGLGPLEQSKSEFDSRSRHGNRTIFAISRVL